MCQFRHLPAEWAEGFGGLARKKLAAAPRRMELAVLDDSAASAARPAGNAGAYMTAMVAAAVFHERVFGLERIDYFLRGALRIDRAAAELACDNR